MLEVYVSPDLIRNRYARYATDSGHDGIRDRDGVSQDTEPLLFPGDADVDLGRLGSLAAD